jgi:predicted porin
VLSQVGGWGAGNNAKYGIQGDVGFDWNGFSFDGVYAYNKDAVALSVYGSIPPALLPTTILKATIENENSLQLAAKYKWNQFTLYGGYQNERISNPSDLPTGAVIGTFNGGYQAVYGNGVGAGTLASATQGTTAFPSAKVLNLFWVGGKYSVLPNLDLIAGYYYVHQNDYLGSTETFGTPTASCSANVTANPLGGTLKGTNSGKCAGNENAISGAIDYRPVKRVDLYAGVMYSKVAGGLASGFFADNNISTVAGVRLSF